MSHQRILIVDDNETSLHLLARNIQEVVWQHYQVITAEDGFKALVDLYAHPFDLMITTYNLPQMNGLELAALAHHLAPTMRIALISDHDFHNIQARARRQNLKLAACRRKTAEVSNRPLASEVALIIELNCCKITSKNLCGLKN